MPYTKDELNDPKSKAYTFYSSLKTKDESKYLELVDKMTTSGDTTDGVLRNKKGGKIILFEKIIPGEGSDGTSHTSNHTIAIPQHGYFKYEETPEINKIIDREITEL
tara:strand:+ start:364 stop:684 length:321 start_codon:yes stop_codon:yes gene_type:complete